MNDKQKAMLLSISYSAYEQIRNQERPGSARFTRLTHGINRLLLLLDIYRPVAWPAEQLRKAEALVDEFNMRLSRVFSGEHLAAGLNVAFGAFETVRDDERPGTERHLRMTSGIDRLLELAEIFNPQDWPEAVMRAAGQLVDDFNIRIAEVFGNQPNAEGERV